MKISGCHHKTEKRMFSAKESDILRLGAKGNDLRGHHD
ncbi:MAG: hypothetical protein K0R64_1897 [Novosphingobium lindaniclasticum]|jgi:hypothetical protein|nr:hypothetical protein [Novosphingobium lindaniclasticum]